MNFVESPVKRETDLKQRRQFLLGVVFNCAEKLISISSGQDQSYQAASGNSYALRYSDYYYSRLRHPEVNPNEIRIFVTLPPGSEKPFPWSGIIPATSIKDGRYLIFLLGKEKFLEGEEFRDRFNGSYLDKSGEYRWMSTDALDVLVKDTVDLVHSYILTYSPSSELPTHKGW